MWEPDAGEVLDELLAHLSASPPQGVPGISIGVMTAGGRASRGVGVAELGTQRPVTAATRFGLCSITKPFTAMLALSLVEDGMLELDRSVVAALPGFRLSTEAATDTVTLRHLLTHTGGFGCELGTDLHAYGADDDAIERALPDFRALPQWCAPGGPWGYCNTGYWLVAALVRAVLGTSFGSAMRDRVLRPLGLEATGFGATIGADDVATPHPASDGSIAPDRTFAMPSVRAASGGLVASMDDLLSFAAVHLAAADTAPLRAEGVSAMATAEVSLGAGQRWQGLGWEIVGAGADRRVGHDGSYGGYESHLVMVPGRSFALAVLTNSDEGWRVCEDLREVGLRVALGIEELAPALASAAIDADAFAGTYDLQGGAVVVEVARGALALTAADGSWGPERYLPLADGGFLLDGGAPTDRLDFPLAETERLIRLDGRLGRQRSG